MPGGYSSFIISTSPYLNIPNYEDRNFKLGAHTINVTIFFRECVIGEIYKRYINLF